MGELKFRTLYADEIEARVQQVTQRGVTLLLYKDARCDMNILDETVGPLSWKKSYSRDNRNCTVSIWDDEKKEWISKEDVGTESNMEREKGLASDSFKRSCFNWGLGRELYSMGTIFVSSDKVNIKNNNGKLACYDKFNVKEIEYDDKRRISYLLIHDKSKGIDVYEWGKKKTKTSPEPEVKAETMAKVEPEPEFEPKTDAIQKTKNELLDELRGRLFKEKIDAKFIIDAYKVEALPQLSIRKIVAMLDNWEKVQAAWARYNA